MARIARIVIPGTAHLASQLGGSGVTVFEDDSDYSIYLEILKEESERQGVRVEGYCLVPDRVLVLAVPDVEAALAGVMGRTNFRYAQYANLKRGQSGKLWHSRFHSCPVQGEWSWAALQRVERLPAALKLTRRPWTWAWSSAAAHTGEIDFTGLVDLDRWHALLGDRDWRATLEAKGDPAMQEALRVHLGTGRPLGEPDWIADMEAKMGRRLRTLPPGRPRKQPA